MDKGSGLDALVSAFLRYAELSAVKFDAVRDIIKIEVALDTSLTEGQGDRFIDACHQSMALFYRMRSLDPIHISLKFIEHAGITILRLYRDSQTLVEEEIELFIRLVRQEFASWLIRDDNDMVTAAFLNGDEKNQVLNKIRSGQESFRNFFVYRDKGRVFVFNR
ncbi:MAG: hypothetical protein ABRQ24_00305 [Syntrophomonadaceae bacterium]